ncbi:MAG: hypothetical protein B6241_10945 [Spirochaetaceae bacterium 4572_59]|nr:MAG: hypothetical protein B6241_10945 [Spirochaetaceae bacterium 4572_59]
MGSYFRRILRFLLILIAIQTLFVGSLFIIVVRSFVKQIISRELEEDIQKIQFLFNTYGDSWIYDTTESSLSDFLMNYTLTITDKIIVYDKDYRIIKVLGNKRIPDELSRKESFNLNMNRIKRDKIESCYFKAIPAPEKLLGTQSIEETTKDTLLFYFITLFLSIPFLLLIAYFGTKRLTANISNISEFINKLAEGARNLDFPQRKVSMEMNVILKSTENLQNQLIQKEDILVHRLQDLTHDLKGPIAGLYIQLEAVELGAMELSKERFKHLYNELGYLNTLIDDMSLLYRLEDNLGEVDIRLMDTEEDLIIPLLERYAPEAEKKGIIIYKDVEVEKLIADSKLLNRAIGNLIHNAIRYGSGLVIDVSVFRKESSDNVIIEVRNKGQIPSEEMPHLFTRYWRKDQDREGGSGLGLAIGYMIALKHGGNLTARNLYSDQVVFQLEIPLGPLS